MKIVSVECLILDGDFPFVKVHTDEGITGIGECFRRQPGVVKALIEEHLAPAISGRDPLDTGLRFRDMMEAGSAEDMGGAVFCAIAGLDIALWDIKGKALGVPIHKLLGGKLRDEVKVYASSMRRDLTPLEEGGGRPLWWSRGTAGTSCTAPFPAGSTTLPTRPSRR